MILIQYGEHLVLVHLWDTFDHKNGRIHSREIWGLYCIGGGGGEFINFSNWTNKDTLHDDLPAKKVVNDWFEQNAFWYIVF